MDESKISKPLESIILINKNFEEIYTNVNNEENNKEAIKEFSEKIEEIPFTKIIQELNKKEENNEKDKVINGPWTKISQDLTNEIQESLENIENNEKVGNDLKEQV